MSPLKIFLATLLITLSLYCTDGVAATVTSCFKSTCAIITAPDHVAPGEEFEIQVEGYIENTTNWDTSAYLLLENAEWDYDSNHMLRFSGEVLDAKGFNWGGNFIQKYKIDGLSENKVFTFVFGSRSNEHGYYDVAVDSIIKVASPTVNVAFDVKPQSCPNPFSTNKRRVLSAAIVGSSSFDVRQIDPATIQLAGVSPIHYSYEDVTEPYYPLTGKVSELDCTDAGPDGHLDLTLKFRVQEIYDALQRLLDRPLSKGEALTITMTAALSSSSGQKPQTDILGEDVIRIVTKRRINNKRIRTKRASTRQ